MSADAKPRLERSLNLRDLVLFNLVAVIGITLGRDRGQGWSQFTYLVVARCSSLFHAARSGRYPAFDQLSG